MKKNIKITIISIIGLALVFFIYKLTFFNIRITSYYSSSGGTERKYEGNLVFRFSKLISGSQSYTVDSGWRCDPSSGQCGFHADCVVENLQWVDTLSKGQCLVPSDLINIPLTEKGILQKIKTGDFKPKGDSCTHGDLCYEITY